MCIMMIFIGMNFHKQIFPLMGAAAIGGLALSSCGQDGQGDSLTDALT